MTIKQGSETMGNSENLSPRKIRLLGLVRGIGIAVGGTIFFLAHPGVVARILWGTGGCIALMSILWPTGARKLHRGWSALAKFMEKIVTQVALGMVFFGVLTPIAVLFRIVGRDVLRLKKVSSATYWEKHDRLDEPEYYRHLY